MTGEPTPTFRPSCILPVAPDRGHGLAPTAPNPTIRIVDDCDRTLLRHLSSQHDHLKARARVRQVRACAQRLCVSMGTLLEP